MVLLIERRRKEGKKPLHSNLSCKFVHKQHHAKINSEFNYLPWIHSAISGGRQAAPSLGHLTGLMAGSAGLMVDAEGTRRMAWPAHSQHSLFSRLGSALYIHFPLGKLRSHHTEIFLRQCISWYSLNSSFPCYPSSRRQFPVGKHPRQLQTVCLSFVAIYRPVIMLLLW